MRILVTGAGGFIGRRIVAAARQSGFAATGTARVDTGDTVAIDVADPSTFDTVRLTGEYDAAIHCAGIAHRFGGVSESEYIRVNVDGTRNIAELAAECGAKRLVILSSVLVYGRHGIGISEAEERSPKDAYALSKVKSEDAAIEAGLKRNMAVTVLRPAPVIGEGCRGNFARLVRAVHGGRFVNVGDGSVRKSMVYVGDLADACIRVLETVPATDPQIFNIAGETITSGEMLDEIYRALGKSRRRVSIPSRPLGLVLQGLSRATRLQSIRSAARSLETWTSEDVFSTDAIRDAIGFVAATPLAEAIRRTVAAYKAENNA